MKIFDDSFIVCTMDNSIEILKLRNQTIKSLIISGKIFVGLDLL